MRWEHAVCQMAEHLQGKALLSVNRDFIGSGDHRLGLMAGYVRHSVQLDDMNTC